MTKVKSNDNEIHHFKEKHDDGSKMKKKEDKYFKEEEYVKT